MTQVQELRYRNAGKVMVSDTKASPVVECWLSALLTIAVTRTLYPNTRVMLCIWVRGTSKIWDGISGL